MFGVCVCVQLYAMCKPCVSCDPSNRSRALTGLLCLLCSTVRREPHMRYDMSLCAVR